MPVVAINGMQGTLNRLTHVFEKTLALFDAANSMEKPTHLSQAMGLVQMVDDDLSQMEKVDLIQRFIANPTIAEVYLSFTDPALRQLWIRAELSGQSDGQAACHRRGH